MAKNSPATAKVPGLSHLHNDIGVYSGFTDTGYLDKRDTPYGEAARFNIMPPGMDISNQPMVEIHPMELKTVTGISYPGDGWPSPKDLPE
jgi:hypothetical protein